MSTHLQSRDLLRRDGSLCKVFALQTWVCVPGNHIKAWYGGGDTFASPALVTVEIVGFLGFSGESVCPTGKLKVQ